MHKKRNQLLVATVAVNHVQKRSYKILLKTIWMTAILMVLTIREIFSIYLIEEFR